MPHIDPYPVRNRVPIQDLRRGRKAASGQEDVVLAFFEAHSSGRWTPFQVLAGTGLMCPITSVRRAMTILTKKGKLVKDDKYQKLEIYGKSNCTWTLVKKLGQLELLEQ